MPRFHYLMFLIPITSNCRVSVVRVAFQKFRQRIIQACFTEEKETNKSFTQIKFGAVCIHMPRKCDTLEILLLYLEYVTILNHRICCMELKQEICKVPCALFGCDRHSFAKAKNSNNDDCYSTNFVSRIIFKWKFTV